MLFFLVGVESIIEFSISANLRALTIYGENDVLNRDYLIRNVPYNTLEEIIISGFFDIQERTFYEFRRLETVLFQIFAGKLGESAFQFCSSLQSIELFEGLLNIPRNIFTGCSSLEYITIPSTVESISIFFARNTPNLRKLMVSKENRCFSTSENNALLIYNRTELLFSCQFLTTIIIPKEIEIIGSFFAECSRCTKIKFENGSKITKINSYSFCQTPYLSEIIFPYGLKSIGSFCFQSSGIENITLPNSITYLSEQSFSGAPYLSSVNISSCENFFNDETGILFNTDKTTIYHIPIHLDRISIPSSVVNIPPQILMYNEVLTSINVSLNNSKYFSYDEALYEKSNPDYSLILIVSPKRKEQIHIHKNTTYIQEAFYKSSIRNVNFDGEMLKVIQPYAFAFTKSLESIILPVSVQSICEYAFYLSAIQLICLSGNVTQIIARAFQSSGLKDADLSQCDHLIEIYDGTFMSCQNLSAVKLPPSISAIREWAFAYCTSLKNIDFPDTIVYIGDHAFDGSSLVYLEIPTKLTDINSYAFRKTSLTNVYIPNNSKLETISDFAFAETLIESFVITTFVRSVGFYAFYNSIKFKKFIVSEDNDLFYSFCGLLTSKDKSTLILCPSGLTNISCPPEIKNFHTGAFQSCTNLEKVEFNRNGSIIFPNNCFEGTNLIFIDMPTFIDSITYSMFRYCKKLKRIDLGYTKVEKIFEYAFEECTSLEEVTLPICIRHISDRAFSGCSNLRFISNDQNNNKYWENDFSLFENLTVIGSYSFFSCRKLNGVLLPKSIEIIGSTSFSYCDSLKDFGYLGINQFEEHIFDGTDIRYVCVYLEYPFRYFCGVPVLPFLSSRRFTQRVMETNIKSTAAIIIILARGKISRHTHHF